MMRQIAGAFAQYEKERLVARLRRAREVKGKMGGRKSLAETRPEVVELARLRHTRSGKQRSLREISAELAARGFVAEKTGRPFEAAQVSRMLAEEMVSSSTSVSHENDASEVTFFRAALGDLARRLEID